jgi:transposase
MIAVSPKHRVFLAISPIDFRKGLNAIAKMCLSKFNQDPTNGHYFVFRNKRKTDIKILYYDGQGHCLMHKRLSTGKFKHWPTSDSALITLTPLQARILIESGDPRSVVTQPEWKPLIDQ